MDISQCGTEAEVEKVLSGENPRISRNADGQFVKGCAPGPGRRKGVTPAADIIRQGLAVHGPELLAVAIEEARDKRNTKLLSDLLKFMVAGKRASYEPVVIEGIEHAATLEEKTRCVMEAATSGKIAPDVAATLLQGYERAEQAQKVEALNAKLDSLTRVVEGKIMNRGYSNG